LAGAIGVSAAAKKPRGLDWSVCLTRFCKGLSAAAETPWKVPAVRYPHGSKCKDRSLPTFPKAPWPV
jgi:hypothetical protein